MGREGVIRDRITDERRPPGAAMASFITRRPAFSAIALAICGALLVGASPLSAQAPIKKDDFVISAPYAILIDADSGTVLFEKNADKPNPPASMSKMMTVEVVLHQIAEGKLKYEDEMT